MKFINLIFGVPLGYLMYFCYVLSNNYGLAIILFTFLAKAITLPLSLIVQKNSIQMVNMRPQLDEIKMRYAGDGNTIAEKQLELYKKEKYSPSLGCLPTLFQIPIILGLINVIYNPMQHLLRFNQETISTLANYSENTLGISLLGSGSQLQIIKAIQQNPSAFMPLNSLLPNYNKIIAMAQSIDMNFLGCDLSQTPIIFVPDSLILIPILSGATALLMCVVQNKINVLQIEQSQISKWVTSALTVILSVYFPFIVPAGVGLYWAVGNLVAILVMYVCNWIYSPSKYINHSQKTTIKNLSKNEKYIIKVETKRQKAKEKFDKKRFYLQENKQLVFYSESGGFYKYFRGIIYHILSNSDIVVNYISSDPSDPIFSADEPNLMAYYIGHKALIPLMMKMDADMVVMTIPDLNNFQLKRSYLRKDIEYIYTDHGLISLNMGYREGALDHYDTFFCVGPHQVNEIRQMEKLYGLKARKIIESGYCMLDDLILSYRELSFKPSSKKKILIAPSWQSDNILEICLKQLLEALFRKEYQIILRPHPEFVKRFPQKMAKILEEYRNELCDDFTIETEFSSNASIFSADLIVTDWSSIAQEFSYATKKPSVFIDTPMKILNPNYKNLGIEPLEITLRNKIGVCVSLSELDTINDVIFGLLIRQDEFAKSIEQIVKENVFNLGISGKVAGNYIIDALEEKKRN